MTTKFLKKGSSFHVVSTANLHLEPVLPVGTYGVVQDPDTGEIYLETIDNFPKLGKLYGDTKEKAKRIWSTFGARSASTGVLLTGEKGCGKTMLAKLLSQMGRSEGVPTIVVNKPLCGESFNQFIQSITQPCVIIFDEYEKVYDEKKHQDLLLTLLDGVFPTKKLFVLTSNDRLGVSNKMLNRPGRIFYAIEYKGLGEDFVREYCKDNLKKAADTDGVVAYSKLFEHFNFDMLKALVEEMNRYKETARQAAAMMNMKVESWQRMMEFEVTVDGKKVSTTLDKRQLIDPANGVSFEIYRSKEDEVNGDGWYVTANSDTLLSIANDVYTYEFREKMPAGGGNRSRRSSTTMKNYTVRVVAKPASYGRKSYEELALAA